MHSISLPALSENNGLSRYLSEIQKFPILSVDEEYELAKNWQIRSDVESAQKLVTSHLKLVAKIAVQFKGYGLPLLDLISEGNIGLMKAVKKFEPDLGYRLSTYAIWWIKASIQDYILKSWSMVKIGTSAMQKKLFFNIKKIKGKLLQLHQGCTERDYNADVAKELGVGVEKIESMSNRMSPASFTESGDGSNLEIWDTIDLADESHESKVIEGFDNRCNSLKLNKAMSTLNSRERDIITSRRLQEKADTLEKLSNIYNVSRERIRQIEENAMKKLKKAIEN